MSKYNLKYIKHKNNDTKIINDQTSFKGNIIFESTIHVHSRQYKRYSDENK